MKENKKETAKVERSIKVSIHLLPFGHVNLNYILGGEEPIVKEHPPVYTEPLTTNIENVDMLHSGEGHYHVPKTTAQA